MSDQITYVTQQNDVDGKPLYFMFTYLFDNGSGTTNPYYITINANNVINDLQSSIAAANIQASAAKLAWMAEINRPAPIILINNPVEVVL